MAAIGLMVPISVTRREAMGAPDPDRRPEPPGGGPATRLGGNRRCGLLRPGGPGRPRPGRPCRNRREPAPPGAWRGRARRDDGPAGRDLGEEAGGGRSGETGASCAGFSQRRARPDRWHSSSPRDLGVPRDQVARSVMIASLSPEAKAAGRPAGRPSRGGPGDGTGGAGRGDRGAPGRDGAGRPGAGPRSRARPRAGLSPRQPGPLRPQGGGRTINQGRQSFLLWIDVASALF